MRKALCVGIDCYEHVDDLHGCVNDAKNSWEISHAHYTMQHLSDRFVCIRLPVPSILPGNVLEYVSYS